MLYFDVRRKSQRCARKSPEKSTKFYEGCSKKEEKMRERDTAEEDQKEKESRLVSRPFVSPNAGRQISRTRVNVACVCRYIRTSADLRGAP